MFQRLTVVSMVLLLGSGAMAQEDEAQENRWPGASTIGVRAGIGGSTGTAGIESGNVGLKVLLNDQMGFTADFGLGITTSRGSSTATFALDAGLLLYLQDSARSLRPYVPLFFGLGVVNGLTTTTNNNVTTGQVFQMALGAGFGAEYFFSKQFSLSADLLLALRFQSFDPITVSIGTLTPGVHASYYF